MKEKIKKRIEEYKKEETVHQANVYACRGAIQALEDLLKEDIKESVEEEK